MPPPLSHAYVGLHVVHLLQADRRTHGVARDAESIDEQPSVRLLRAALLY
jgi:hypothetical protein